MLLSLDHTLNGKAFRYSVKSSLEINVTAFQQQDSGVNSLWKHLDPEPDGILSLRHPFEEFTPLD